MKTPAKSAEKTPPASDVDPVVMQLVRVVDNIQTAIFVRQLDNDLLDFECKEMTRERYFKYLSDSFSKILEAVA